MTADVRAAVRAELTALRAAWPVYLTIPEVGEALRVTPRTVERMIDRGELEDRRAAYRRLVPRASLEAWVVRQAGLDPVELELVPDAGADVVPLHR